MKIGHNNRNKYNTRIKGKRMFFFTFNGNLVSMIHTVHSPTDAHLITLITTSLKLDGSYMFRSTTIIREPVNEPG